MPEPIVHTFRVRGQYRNKTTIFKNTFEKEVRAVSADDAVATVKRLIGSRNVNSNCIHIAQVLRIDNPEHVRDRVVRTFASESMKI